MARTNNLTNFLNDVATAIKTKLGDNTPIPASQFDTKIGEIETGGTYQSKTINVTTNGSQTVTPDTGYDALSSVLINVQVPIPSLQTKNYEFTQNTHIVLSPETGYDGFSSIDLTINVPGSQINNQDKTITENGTYTADSGYTGIGTATVNVIPPIKMYNTREEMMNDTVEPEHEYGIVYGDKTYPITEGAQCTQFICKETVTLDNAITTTKIWSDASRDLTIRIQPTSASITYYSAGIKRVQYTSSDGITYTTTSTLANRTFEGNFNFSSTSYSWIPQISDFLIGGGMYFEGMYEYANEVDDEWFDAITDIQLTNTTFTSTNEEQYLPTLNIVVKELHNHIYAADGYTWYYFVYEKNGHYYAQKMTGGHFAKKTTDNYLYIPITSQQVGSVLTSQPLYELDLENETFTFVENVYAEFIATRSAWYYGWKHYDFNEITAIGMYANGTYSAFTIANIIEGSTLIDASSYTKNYQYGQRNEYISPFENCLRFKSLEMYI